MSATRANRAAAETIVSYGVPTSLLSDFELEVAGVVLDDWQAEFVAIGELLCGRGQDDLWRDVYKLHYAIYEYSPGDEVMFLAQAAGPAWSWKAEQP